MSNLVALYRETERKNEGRWFALAPDGETIAVASTSGKLWKKIRRRYKGKEVDLFIGYSQTKQERETACLLPLLQTNES